MLYGFIQIRKNKIVVNIKSLLPLMHFGKLGKFENISEYVCPRRSIKRRKVKQEPV